MQKYRRLAVATIAACLTIGLAAAPSTSLAAAGKTPKAKAAISKKKLNQRLKRVQERTEEAQDRLETFNRAIRWLDALSKSNNDKADLLLAAAPQLVNGLTQLRAGLEQAGAGLTALRTAVTALGTAVQTTIPNAIRDVATSQEYGVTSIMLDLPGSDNDTFLPLGVTSSDIPDDVNTASASGEVPLVVGTGANGTVPAGAPIVLRSAIRSGESDGLATGDPAGYVGGLMTMKCAGGTSGAIPGGCDVNGPAGGGDVPAGALVCAVGPPASTEVSPGVNAFVVKIQEKSGRADLSKPSKALDAQTVNPLAGAADGSGPLVNNALDGCNVGGAAGDAYTLTVQTQYLDPATSTTPGATE